MTDGEICEYGYCVYSDFPEFDCDMCSYFVPLPSAGEDKFE